MSLNKPEVESIGDGAPFWAAVQRGIFLLKRSKSDGRWFFYPRDHSPFGDAGETEWCEASGRGEIYSCSVSARASPPYCIAYVRLDEGPIMLTNILHKDLDEIRIGQRVRIHFMDTENGRKLPMFVLDLEMDRDRPL